MKNYSLDFENINKILMCESWFEEDRLKMNEHNEGYYCCTLHISILCYFNESTLIFHSVINHSKINKFLNGPLNCCNVYVQ